jgi:hypothetical protein
MNDHIARELNPQNELREDSSTDLARLAVTRSERWKSSLQVRFVTSLLALFVQKLFETEDRSTWLFVAVREAGLLTWRMSTQGLCDPSGGPVLHRPPASQRSGNLGRDGWRPIGSRIEPIDPKQCGQSNQTDNEFAEGRRHDL